MRFFRQICLLLPLLCAPLAAQAEPPAPSRGETLYVPVYSHIWHGNVGPMKKPEQLMLSTLLSIRNTDPDRPIMVRQASYYDTDGKILRQYAEQPRLVPPMGTIEYFVELTDTAGGSGANFIVEWSAEAPASPPIVEAVHVYFRGNQSLAFLTQGRPIAKAPAR